MTTGNVFEKYRLFICLFAGILFTNVSVTVAGYGAAMAIPTSLLQPLASFSPGLAFGLVDLITIGLPLAFLLALLGWLLKRLTGDVNYLALVLPYLLFSLYHIVKHTPATDPIYWYMTALPKVVAVAVCAIVLSRFRYFSTPATA